MNQIQSLLDRCAIVNLKYQKIEEASKASFNIFSILRTDADEVWLHSSFIAELLDPKGSHQLGDLFQILFFETIDAPQQSTQRFPCVQTEVSVAEGRIDILMRGGNSGLVIENKIYAPDQPKQLQHYYEFLKSRYPQAKPRILYLTLFGSQPSNDSRGSVPEAEIQLISYSQDILKWLERCAKESYQIPHLRESLIQYISLVKKLTGQTISEEHKMELMKLLLQGDNLESALTLEKAIGQTKIEVQRLVWQELLQELSSRGFHFDFVDSDFHKQDVSYCRNFYALRNRARCFGIKYDLWAYDDLSVHLCLEVDHRLYVAFTAAKNGTRGKYAQEVKVKHPLLQEIIVALADWDKASGEDWWCAWKYTEPRVNFMDFQEAYGAKLANSVQRKKWVEEIASELIRLIERFKVESAKIPII